MKKIKERLKHYTEAYLVETLFIVFVIIAINMWHPYDYYINWKESFKKFIEQRTPLVLSENPNKKYYVRKKSGLFIGSSYYYEYALETAIFPQDKPLPIKPPYYLRVGVANIEDKTLEDSTLTLHLPDGISISDKNGWTEFEPNKQYFVKLGNINPKVLMNISPMKLKFAEENIAYEIKCIISGKDIEPVIRNIIVMKTK